MAPKSPALDIAKLVADHYAVVYRYAYRLTGVACDAEDLTQQAFLNAQLKLDQLRDPEHSRGWLLAIVRSCYLKMRRKRLPIPAGSLEMEVACVPDDVPGQQAIEQHRLQSAIDELPDDFKLVLVLFYFDGCSYREIARQLGLPAGTVMSRLYRAKKHLRSRLCQREVQEAAQRNRKRKSKVGQVTALGHGTTQ